MTYRRDVVASVFDSYGWTSLSYLFLTRAIRQRLNKYNWDIEVFKKSTDCGTYMSGSKIHRCITKKEYLNADEIDYQTFELSSDQSRLGQNNRIRRQTHCIREIVTIRPHTWITWIRPVRLIGPQICVRWEACLPHALRSRPRTLPLSVCAIPSSGYWRVIGLWRPFSVSRTGGYMPNGRRWLEPVLHNWSKF